MKIVLSASQPNLQGEVDPRFGRCRYFIFVDPGTMQYEAEENPGLKTAGSAGISAAQFIVDKGVEALITGNIGTNAYRVLKTAGIEMFTGVSGGIRDIVEIYKSGELRRSPGPSEGMDMGCGRARGSGMGNRIGSGRSGGQGVKRDAVAPRAEAVDQSVVRQESSTDQIAYLKDQAQILAERLARIQIRIQQLEEQARLSSSSR